MSSLLAELYVQVTARGVSQTAASVNALAGNLARASNAANQVDRNISRVSSLSGSMDRMAGSVGGINKAAVGASGGFGQMAASAGMAAGAIGAVVAAISAMATAGLAGTIEGNSLGQAFTEIAREVSAVFLPVIQGVTDILFDLLNAFRSAGVGAQDLLFFIGPAGVMLKVFSDPQLQGGIRRLVGAFGEVAKSLAPLLALGTRIASTLLNVFVVTPILVFAKGLEVLAKIAASLINLFTTLGGVMARALGFGDVFAGGGAAARRRVTLQGGDKESAEGTFDRFQSAALKIGSGRPIDEQQLDVLKKIDEAVKIIKLAIEAVTAHAATMSPAALAAGAVTSGAGLLPFGGGLIGGAISSLFGRP